MTAGRAPSPPAGHSRPTLHGIITFAESKSFDIGIIAFDTPFG